MLKVRLYLAVTAYVVLIKRYVHKSLDCVFGLCCRTNKLFRILRKVTSTSAKICNRSSIGKIRIPLHTHSSLGISKGYQIQVIRI